MKLNKYLIAFVAFALSLATVSAQTVKSVTPPASYINAAGQTVQITVGTIIPSGAEITTGPGGAVGVTLPSGATVAIDSASTVVISGGNAVDISAGSASVTTTTTPVTVKTKGGSAKVPSNTKVTGTSSSDTQGNIVVDQGTQPIVVTNNDGTTTTVTPIVAAPVIPPAPVVPEIPDVILDPVPTNT